MNVGVLGVVCLNAPSSDFDEIFFISQPYISTNPLYKNDIGVQPYYAFSDHHNVVNLRT